MKNLPQPLLGEGKKNKKIRVVVAMSGGVDSSVAAALLKKQGYDVVGVFMRFWSEARTHVDINADGRGNSNSCCSEGAEQAARAVATKLEIPFYVLRVEKEFKKAVVDYFLKEEKRGRTPNPCVICNKKIKFGLLFDKAMGMGAGYIATGHYARINGGVIPRCARNDNVVCKLFKAKDDDKDQSYFLYTLTQDKLSRILFPLGEYKKDEVYKLAKKWGLPYRQGESFDLCFVAQDRESFVKRYLKIKEGEIKNIKNETLGNHQGLALYTIGQRKNIPISPALTTSPAQSYGRSKKASAGRQGPWWVVKKDNKKNILYVTNSEKDLYKKELIAENVNWLIGEASSLPIKVFAKIRYKSEVSAATLRPVSTPSSTRGAQGKNYFKVIFEKPQRAITPGQSVVFYDKSGELLGGGTIS